MLWEARKSVRADCGPRMRFAAALLLLLRRLALDLVSCGVEAFVVNEKTYIVGNEVDRTHRCVWM